MPSFMIHTIAGEKMIKKLHLENEDKKKFFISNLVPDTLDRSAYAQYKGEERRSRKQKIKRITHFRTDFNQIFEYPNLELFLSKYEEQTKKDINFLGYFFHLYTDYYYFSHYLPQIIVFYDKNHNISKRREENVYVEIKNYNREIGHEDFWDNYGKESIYEDYSRLNKYLVNKYPLSFAPKELIEYLKTNNYKVDMEEINSDYAIQAIENLKRIVDECLGEEKEQLKIFTIDQIENLIDETVNTFLDKYESLLKEYM
jgi:hypothetical protein